MFDVLYIKLYLCICTNDIHTYFSLYLMSLTTFLALFGKATYLMVVDLKKKKK